MEVVAIAIYHCSIQIISRSDGRSAVAAAAYRSGTNLVNEWSGRPANYDRKKGIAYSEIMLPDNAPAAFSDRQMLWNSVEMNEKRSDAQFAREIEVALPQELPLEEHKKIIHAYCQQFVDTGMCVDFSIHDKHDGNPHCHIMLTMRALDENGKWLPKSHQEFELDENGERIRLPNGRWKSRKVDTVDWNSHENAERWRASWAETVNRFLKANQVPERIDHRSNVERGLEELPTIHMGVAACAMEKKGIPTERGDINRKIRAANRIIREIRSRINDLKAWLSELSVKLEQFAEESRSPLLSELLWQHMEQESQRIQKYSQHFQLLHTVEIGNDMMETLRKLNAKDIYTLADLETALTDLREKVEASRSVVKGKERRMKELQKLIDTGRQFLRTDSIRKERNSIRFKKKREEFEESHHADLVLWQAANKFLHARKVDTATLPDSIKAWQTELAALTAEHDAEYEKLKQYREEVRELDSVRRQAEKAMTPKQSKNRKTNIEL
ncbi:MAG: MobA/MobL family protein [Clostridiales bacterium]|nr:MobA/MobL family protein [Clostridiales bacterium]